LLLKMKSIKGSLKNCLLQTNISCLTKNRRSIILFLLFIFSFHCKAQIANYVANGSFEERYNCIAPYPLMKAKYWLSIDSSSVAGGYRSTCNLAVPGNYQYPKTGNAYILNTFYYTGNARGYLKNRLKQTLQANKTYCVKFYVNIWNGSTYGMDGFGIYFGDNTIDTITKCNIPLPYLIPQVQNPTNNVIVDTLNWVPITGTFVANGTEKYALIGNFKSNAVIDTLLINSTNLPLIFTDACIDDASCIDIDLPADAGPDLSCIPGNSVYIGRPQDVGIDEACMWYQLPNMTTAIDTAAGTIVWPVGTTTYVVRQELWCGGIKWDTVVVYADAVGLQEAGGKSQDLRDVRLYPVPAGDYVELQVSETSGSEPCKITLVDPVGRLIREEELSFKEGKAMLKLADLTNGAYLIVIENGPHQKIIKKLLIAK
jgi:hypothetical protein